MARAMSGKLQIGSISRAGQSLGRVVQLALAESNQTRLAMGVFLCVIVQAMIVGPATSARGEQPSIAPIVTQPNINWTDLAQADWPRQISSEAAGDTMAVYALGPMSIVFGAAAQQPNIIEPRQLNSAAVDLVDSFGSVPPEARSAAPPVVERIAPPAIDSPVDEAAVTPPASAEPSHFAPKADAGAQLSTVSPGTQRVLQGLENCRTRWDQPQSDDCHTSASLAFSRGDDEWRSNPRLVLSSGAQAFAARDLRTRTAVFEPTLGGRRFIATSDLGGLGLEPMLLDQTLPPFHRDPAFGD